VGGIEDDGKVVGERRALAPGLIHRDIAEANRDDIVGSAQVGVEHADQPAVQGEQRVERGVGDRIEDQAAEAADLDRDQGGLRREEELGAKIEAARPHEPVHALDDGHAHSDGRRVDVLARADQRVELFGGEREEHLRGVT
jgi:hypothetical protein